MVKEAALRILGQEGNSELVRLRPGLLVMVDLRDSEPGRQLAFVVLVGGEKFLVGGDRFVEAVQEEQVLGMEKAYVSDELMLAVGGDEPLGCPAAGFELLELVLADSLLAEHLGHLAVIPPPRLHSLEELESQHPVGRFLEHQRVGVLEVDIRYDRGGFLSALCRETFLIPLLVGRGTKSVRRLGILAIAGIETPFPEDGTPGDLV